MFRFASLSVGLLLTTLLCQTVRASDILPAGQKLVETLDGMNVEKLWLPKESVNWETGKTLSKPITDTRAHTHCSAFVAAAAMRMDIYILRPPEHATNQLANAQFDWLQKEGSKKGWKTVKGPIEAQELANKGSLVVAVYKATADDKHGHIAIVRPSTKSEASIEEEGPQIIQAGTTNYNSTSVKEGFKHHPGAFKKGEICYFVHNLELK